jgi:DNA invertase Pin-like site-specific DNA recombinase
MLNQMAAHKVQADHLDRQALIYVRQSTFMQVLKNTGSKIRQYDLAQRAVELGWPPERIVVIDEDQGTSGTSFAERDGFEQVVAEVGLGRTGAVFCLEASRLARSCSNWYRLIEICALTRTLVVDEDGVYDPGQYNDRLVLGIKGAMSESELHWLHNRLMGGKLAKAQQGELRLPLPTGLVYDAANQVRFDPDEEVQQAVQLLFDLFKELGTANAVTKHFKDQGLLFPTRQWGGVDHGQLTWKPLGTVRVLDVLHNPAYAGAYAYGRRQSQVQVLPDQNQRLVKQTRRLNNPEKWTFLLLENHPGYITWAQFLRNEQRLDDNRTSRAEDRRGPAREGTALLQGIALCGCCGRRMTIHYLEDGLTPVYKCTQAYHQFGEPTCQTIRGDGIDAAVAQTFLAAMQPAQLEISLATLQQLEAQAQQIDEQWQRRLERARYEADLSRRRLFAVEPENRLVARNLERDWNEKLAEVERLEREYLTLPQPPALVVSPEERERILALAQDLPAIWQAETTTYTERKQLLRFLIKDVTITRQETTIHLGLRWQTEALTELDIPRPKRSSDFLRTSATVLERIGTLAPTHTDRQIAAVLNENELTTGIGQPFTGSKVRWVRRKYAIATGCPEAPSACPTGQRADGRYCTQAAAELLNVCDSTILRWCEVGRLDSLQAVPNGPRWIKLTSELIAELRKPTRRSLSDHSAK